MLVVLALTYEVKTQDEDEVYEIQLGQYLGRGKKQFVIFMDND